MPPRSPLQRLVEEEEGVIRELEGQLEFRRARLAKLRELEAMELSRPLRTVDTNSTVRTMDVNTEGQSEAVKRGAGRATRKHPAQRKLYEKGRTITEVAKELGEGRPRVSAWFAPVGKGNRPIPRRHAETLRDDYGIPLTAWARVAD